MWDSLLVGESANALIVLKVPSTGDRILYIMPGLLAVCISRYLREVCGRYTAMTKYDSHVCLLIDPTVKRPRDTCEA